MRFLLRSHPQGWCTPHQQILYLLFATPEALSVKVEDSEMPYPIICEGAFFAENLLLTGISEKAVDNLLSKHSLSRDDVLLLTCDKQKGVYLQPYVGDAVMGETLCDE